MKRIFTAAILVAGIMTSANCLAALQYSFDREAKVFTVKSEDVISLEEGANQLKVAFVKQYNLGPDKKGRVPAVVKPKYGLQMYIEGSVRYEFADNANYWQQHNYTYAEMTRIKKLETERAAIAKKQEANKKADEAAKTANKGKKVALSNKQLAERKALSERDLVLAEQQKQLIKTKEELKRNASTLIYLDVENKLSRVDTSKKLYDFKIPKKSVDTEQRSEDSVKAKEQNLMEQELAQQAAKQKQLERQAERERLAQLNVDNPEAAAKLREKLLADEEAEKKLAASDANAKKINERLAQKAPRLEEVKATRAAFLKYQAEQKEAMKGMAFTSRAEGKLSAGDNFFKKVNNSLLKETPLFFEVKFWCGGANQRLWLQKAKLEELQQLLEYDLYKDNKHAEVLK